MLNIYSGCCKTILVKLEGIDLLFICKLSGVKNGNPMWRTIEGYEIYYENDKWILGGGPYGPNGPDVKYFISNSSHECPESVESWSNHGPHGLKLEGGKIECDSTL